jgi:chorismate dehydratase
LKKTKLLIGKIPYANLFPVHYYLENKCKCNEYKFISGAPSTLNRMLRAGKIDISTSSSIEYLRYKDIYSLIPCFSISSEGPVYSIYLFSKIPLETLNNKTIALSSESETSVVLLKIILSEFLGLKCRFRTVKSNSLKKVISTLPACLLIGDAAMKEAKKLATGNCQLATLYIYDLGELWFKYTGLPFVFALMITRKDSLEKKYELIKKFSKDAIRAKRYVSKNLNFLAHQAPQRKWLSTKELVDYWKGISYEFTERHMEGLRLFEKYALKY